MKTLKHPDEDFEDKFLACHSLKYDRQCLFLMKKNTNTCVQLLYNLCARTWKESMMSEIKDKLELVISVIASKHIRDKDATY